ncbi:MAG: DUF998 domain-containing protein [Actinobacteria bacterium]|nr:DUF998 domain-containing protein [Actinomycetota bacterium]
MTPSTSALSKQRYPWVTPVALASSLSAIVIFGGSTFVAELMTPGFDPVRQTISELAAGDAPTRIFVTIAFVLTGACHMLTASFTPGVAAVAGYTATRGDYSLWRALVSIVNRWAVCMLVGIYVRNPNYIHMYRREAVSQAHLTCTGSPALFAELLSICARFGEIVEIPVRYVPRTTGRATGARWQSILATGRGLVRLALSRHVSEHVRPKPN